MASMLQFNRDIPRMQDGTYFSRQNLVSHRVLTELSALPDAHGSRFIFKDPAQFSQYWSMNASYYGLRTFQGYMNPLPIEQFEQTFQRFNLRHYYPLLGARYYICTICEGPMLADYRPAGETSDGYKIYVSDAALPRFTVINRIAGSYKDADEFYSIINSGYDYDHAAYMEGGDALSLQQWLGSQGEADFLIKQEQANINNIKLSVSTKGRALLLFNEFYSKDWSAKVNGVPASILRLNLNQIGVQLEDGPNLVELEYKPRLFIILLWVQRVTLLALVLICIFSFRNSWMNALIRPREDLAV
jgi:hypothetical protein